MGARGVLQLQQLVGNRAVTEMIQRSVATGEASTAADTEMDDGCACGGGCAKCSTAVSRSAATETATTQTAAPEGGESETTSHLVDSDPAPGQMTKDAFLSELQGSVTASASMILAPTGWTADNCPDLVRWFAYYQDKDAAHVERAIHKYAPGTANAESARDYIPAVTSKVQRAVLRWTFTGEVTGVPEEATTTPGAPPVPNAEEIASTMSAQSSEEDGGQIPPVQRAARDGAAAMDGAPAVITNLGEGRPLDGSVASRFGTALGGDFSHVRVHTGAEAATAASGLGARAFTYGHHVGFDSGEYQPGTPVGDAILAHELAHVDQQRNTVATVGTAPRPNATAALGSAQRGNDSRPGGPTGDDKALEHDADRAATGAIARLWTAASDVANGVLQAPERLRTARPRLQRCNGCGNGCGTSQAPPLGSSPATSMGTDFHAGIGRPTGSQISSIETALNPTSTGSGGVVLNWDGQSDAAKRQELRTKLLTALQNYLNNVNPQMQAMAQAKAAGNVLSTAEQEGAGKSAKRYVDNMFGGITSAAALTSSQEAARTAFQFRAGTELLDASDPSVQPLTSGLRKDLVDWIGDSDSDARQAQRDHGFNRLRQPPDVQGEGTFWNAVRANFIATGTNQADLDRFNQFGFAYQNQNPTRILSQTAIRPGALSSTPVNPGEPSPAERRERWATWELLVHEYIHTLEHPSFTAARQGNRIMFEGFCELFTKAVLTGGGGGIATAKGDSDPPLRHEVEGGDYPGFDPGFVPNYNAGDYADYLTQAEAIVSQVGMQAAKAAFFMGHVEAIGLRPDGSMIDPSAPDADQFLAPEKVKIPASVTTVRGVAQMTGVGESEIVAANSGLAVGGTLPASAHTTGLTIPNTSHHRTIAARSATQTQVETKAKIAQQHGIAETDIERANPALASSEPTEGQWVLIPNH